MLITEYANLPSYVIYDYNKPTLKMKSGKYPSKSELFYDGKCGSPLFSIARTNSLEQNVRFDG